MNKRIDLTQIGGFPFTQEILDFMQVSYREAFKGIASLCGNKTILTGVVDNGVTITSGWISYNGELIPFIGGATGADVVVEETSVDLTFEDAVDRPVLFTKVAYIGGPATFPFSDLKPLTALNNIWLPGDVKEVDCSDAYVAANFDGTGLGVNERAGWAVCNGANGTRDRRGRFPVGWDDRAIDPANGWWDILYNTMGATGGLKGVTLSMSALPNPFSLTVPVYNEGGNGFIASGGAPFEGNFNVNFSNPGGGQAHENRPPFIVTLFIQKL
jgi:hypothetical protein